jgi:L-threonylcarbamoyladenylate synthase
MESKHWRVKAGESLKNHPGIMEAARLIRQGEVVAFPTETVYGLGANALCDDAVRNIFIAKGRPSDNPLIIHIHHKEQIKEIALELPPIGEQLLEAFSPGPLTLILKGNGKVSPLASAGLDTIGVRIPSHPVALELLRQSGLPIAAPSANRSGRPSPTKASHVLEDLNGRIAGVLDGGETGVGVESTVIDLTVSPPMILRPGGITREQIEAVIGPVQIDPSLEREHSTPRSPGMKYAHYAPNAPLRLIDHPDVELQREYIVKEAEVQLNSGKRIGIFTTDEGIPYYQERLGREERLHLVSCGKRSDLSTVARELYHALRSFNALDVNLILCESFPRTGIGAAVMNRLSKAAGGQVVDLRN